MKSWLSCASFCCVQDVDILKRCNVGVVHKCTTLRRESSCNRVSCIVLGLLGCIEGLCESWNSLECKVAFSG